MTTSDSIERAQIHVSTSVLRRANLFGRLRKCRLWRSFQPRLSRYNAHHGRNRPAIPQEFFRPFKPSARRRPMTNEGLSSRPGIGPLAKCPPTLFPSRRLHLAGCNFHGPTFLFLSLPLLLLIAASAWAAPASDTLLPKSTKGYLSVAHPKDFEDRWNKTQLGLLFADDTMQGFQSDLRKQMSDEFGAAERKLGITFNDLKGVTGGELSLSVIERKSPDATMAITINVTGHQKEADGLLAHIERSFAKRGGKKTNSKVGDTTLIVFDIPAQKSAPKQQTVYFLKDDLLCGADDRAEVEAMLKRFDGKATDNLKSVPAYVATMARCSKEAGQLEPEARWFVEPFGFIFAARTLRSSQHHGQDMAKILYDNGFDAIQGAGGYVNQLVDGHIEYLLRASVYAPPVKGKENDPLRWNLSMRMMQLPNGPAVEPESWVPRMVANYSTMNASLVDAFDNIGPLFDAVQEHEDAWKNTLEGWTTDPYGPQVDVRKEFIGNLTNRDQCGHELRYADHRG